MTIVRRLIRVWLALAIGAGLTPPPITGAGAASRIERTNAAPLEDAALTPGRPVAAAGAARGELRLDGTSRSQQKTLDLVARDAAPALTAAGLACTRHNLAAALAAASTFALRGPPRSV